MVLTYLSPVAEAIRLAVPVELVPDDADELFLLYALLAKVKGNATTTEDVHDAWTVWKTIRGEAHPSIQPFHDLEADVQNEDVPFLRAIQRAARTL